MVKILIKKWPKWLFFEKVTAKITKCFNCGNFYIRRGLKLFGSVFFAGNNCFFDKESSFNPKTAISAMNLTLCTAACLN